jgi:histidinol phosphatase-like PHP family hydrolase
MRSGLDYHIHTFYQRCGNETLTVENIVRRAQELGLTSIAITDHLNRLEQLPMFPYIRHDIETAETDVEVFFGVELNFMGCDGEWAYSEQIRDEYGFELAIGGIHSAYTDSQDPVEVVDIQHRHHMRTLTDPLIDVLVHPYWFGKADLEKRPKEWWERLIAEMPDDRIIELAQASAEHKTPIEVNACAIFYSSRLSAGFIAAYMEYLRRLHDSGALFTVASDAHDIARLGTTEYVEGLLDGIGVSTERIWRPERQ